MKRTGKHEIFRTNPIIRIDDYRIYGDIELLPTKEDFRREVMNAFMFNFDVSKVEVWYCGLRMNEGERLWMFTKEKRRGTFPVWRIEHAV